MLLELKAHFSQPQALTSRAQRETPHPQDEGIGLCYLQPKRACLSTPFRFAPGPLKGQGTSLQTEPLKNSTETLGFSLSWLFGFARGMEAPVLFSGHEKFAKWDISRHGEY